MQPLAQQRIIAVMFGVKIAFEISQQRATQATNNAMTTEYKLKGRPPRAWQVQRFIVPQIARGLTG